jgi:hypothetical protein
VENITQEFLNGKRRDHRRIAVRLAPKHTPESPDEPSDTPSTASRAPTAVTEAAPDGSETSPDERELGSWRYH